MIDEGEVKGKAAGPKAQPVVSVIMANHNGAAYLPAAIRSVLAQSLRQLELILVDDCSTDGSLALMKADASADDRVTIIQAPHNLGPGGARNLALERACGRWIAVVDSDDLLHPRRLERLVEAADRDDADIAADDILLFEQNNAFRPSALLGEDEPRWLGTAEYIGANALFGRGVALGYLKPVFRREKTFGAGLRYNESLRIAEDYDIVARMMLAGARFRVYPQMTYFYRKHAGSISHRLSADPLRAMLAADDLCHDAIMPRDVEAAALRRRRSIVNALAFTELVAALKQRRLVKATMMGAANPAAAMLLRYPVLDRFRRKPRQAPAAPPGGSDVCLITRQRVVGSTNGSSAYLLNLCETVARLGLRVHLICPSPSAFGRWPVLMLRPEMKMFSSLRVRGGLRLGRAIIATDPRIAWSAALTIANRVAMRLGLTRKVWIGPAPYSIGAPWTRADYLFLAQYARPCADLMIADYVFQTEGFPYALRPEAATAVIMHDLFSSRVSQFAKLGEGDSVTVLTEASEFALLSQSDAVIAIQNEEAQLVRRNLPHQHVMTVPMACTPGLRPAPGEGLEVLFVGSGAAPNVIGLRWFVEKVWPTVLQAVPGAKLVIAGAIGNAADRRTPRLDILGQVPDLEQVYQRAAVVISPLLAGSGLKIKLVEALARGKAVVATAATLQGLGPDLGDAVIEAETPEAFAEAVTSLLLNPKQREACGRAALDLAARLFSPVASHQPLVSFLQRTLVTAAANHV